MPLDAHGPEPLDAHGPEPLPPPPARRAFLAALGGGLGCLGLDVALARAAAPAGGPGRSALAPRPPLQPAHTPAVIQKILPRGMNHNNTINHKPEH